MAIKNKRILITAGPTWVPIDSVRVIGNIATGKTGILLAERLKNLGAKVTLLLGPVEACCLSKNIRLIRFKYFDDLKNTVLKELRSKKYDIVIHSAAVSDYKPLKIYYHKIKSNIKNWRLNLVPTEKIIDLIRKIDYSLFLVGFKFELGINKKILINRARSMMSHARLNLGVANTIDKNRYQAYIINQNKTYGPLFNRNDLTKKLIKIITSYELRGY